MKELASLLTSGGDLTTSSISIQSPSPVHSSLGHLCTCLGGTLPSGPRGLPVCPLFLLGTWCVLLLANNMTKGDFDSAVVT